MELINKNIPEALINSVPKPGRDVTFDGVGKQNEVFFGVCSMFSTSFIHATLSSGLMILHAHHGAEIWPNPPVFMIGLGETIESS